MQTFLILILILIVGSGITFFFYERRKSEKKQFITFILNVLENTNKWENWGCTGLCSMIAYMYYYDEINYKTYNKYKKLLKSMAPNDNMFWFEQGRKQPRIDYLKKQLFN